MSLIVLRASEFHLDQPHRQQTIMARRASPSGRSRTTGLDADEADEEKGSVIVIGAGLAGLAAARELVERYGYHNVLVLEGRPDRIGGRVWTSNQWGPPVDLGASWIHGTTMANPIARLARNIGATLHATSYERSVIFDTTTGRPLTARQEKRLAAVQKKFDQIIEKAQDHDEDTTIRNAVEPLLLRQRRFFKRDEDSTEEQRRWIEFIYQSTLETEYAGSVDELSTYWHDSHKDFAGGDAVFADGYRVIIDHLAEGLHIERDQVVTEIQWSNKNEKENDDDDESSPVRVITAAHSVFTADHVIVTVPLGVLQHETIQFTPPLPQRKKQAIAQLKMGVLNKCYLRFTESFWSDQVDWIECVSETGGKGEWTEWLSLTRTMKAPVLMGFTAGHRAKEMEEWSDEEIVDSAMTTLRSVFGPNIPNPVDAQITRWANDPFSYGSYSFNAIGSHPNMRKDLAAPIGRVLFFAGEATEHHYFGTAHGAYLSGIRAARDVAGPSE
jgi:monoamine oxidase